MNLELIPQDDPRLHTKCTPFNPRSPDFDLENTLILMFQVMLENNGIGLAAPQVGINKRFFIMKIEGEEFVCINPIITKTGKDIAFMEEGCLSFPGQRVMVQRPSMVRVKYMTPKGLTKTTTFRGMKARCFQHEHDHLDGVVFTKRGESINDLQHLRST